MKQQIPNAEERLAAALNTVRPKLFRYCARMIGSAVDAEDVVQDVLLVAQEKLPDANVKNTEAWLMRIAHNKAIDHLRTRARYRMVQFEDTDLPDTYQRPFDAQEAAKVALSVFLQLTPLQRACVILKDVLGYKLAEVAEMLGDQTVGSVKAALARGRQNLQRLATQTTEEQVIPLEPEAAALLRLYAKRFQERDISGIQRMLLDDVRLDLVAVVRAQGKDRVGKYFGNYRALDELSLTIGQVEGRPALYVEDGGEPFVVVLEFEVEHIAAIRDFHFARHSTDSMAFHALKEVPR
ncbi:sigma-70 family RNA polymerase sigma factor [uncultured Tateyamaria sp.]|uniref:RNA polymerase sigma factor n=1 Tax=uncultured Tateyamaria sp. TaxID=455651 RepID=UPI002611F5A5|nr:sigma-70 family RNA polymerase sigma factor [uncultured Tateyamaria sp.]